MPYSCTGQTKYKSGWYTEWKKEAYIQELTESRNSTQKRPLRFTLWIYCLIIPIYFASFFLLIKIELNFFPLCVILRQFFDTAEQFVFHLYFICFVFCIIYYTKRSVRNASVVLSVAHEKFPAKQTRKCVHLNVVLAFELWFVWWLRLEPFSHSLSRSTLDARFEVSITVDCSTMQYYEFHFIYMW